MKIVIAPDSFKESLSSSKVCDSIESGFKNVFPEAEFVKVPIADGGEGTVATLIEVMNGSFLTCKVFYPLGDEGTAKYGIFNHEKQGKTAVIELAESSGLQLVPKNMRNPGKTSTYGFGQMIMHALDIGVKNFILGLGGSATNDGGAGMLHALGVVFLDAADCKVMPCGENLDQIQKIDLTYLDKRLNKASIKVACDINNLLCGKNGASMIFSAQKGALPQQQIQLDLNLQHFANVAEKTLSKSSQNIAGTGAAGGTGFGLLHFLNSELVAGAELILKTINFSQKIDSADLIITGEGRMDGQSILGKAPIAVAKFAKQKNIPVIAIVGSLSQDYDVVYDYGIDAVFPCITRVDTLENTLAGAYQNIQTSAMNIAKLLKISFLKKK